MLMIESLMWVRHCSGHFVCPVASFLYVTHSLKAENGQRPRKVKPCMWPYS